MPLPNTTITSADSVYMLSVASIFPTPVQLQGFGADAAFETEATDSAETMFGVDGKMSAGFVFNPIEQTITLQADSLSNVLFETWQAEQKSRRELLIAQATVILPATGRKYAHINGVLRGAVAIPAVRRVLQPRGWRITWEKIDPASV